MEIWLDAPCWERAGAFRPQIWRWVWRLGCTQREAGRLAPRRPALVQATLKPLDGLLLSLLLAVYQVSNMYGSFCCEKLRFIRELYSWLL